LHASKGRSIVSASLQDLREELVRSPSTDAVHFVFKEESVPRFARGLNVLRSGLRGHYCLLPLAALMDQDRYHW
jgi:hypothetical protein